MSESSEPTVEHRSSEQWEQEFARRMLLTEPKDTIRGMFCTGMLRIVGSLGGEEIIRRCQEASGEEKFVDFFNYPMAVYLRMISAAVRLLADRYGGVEEALRQLGRLETGHLLGRQAINGRPISELTVSVVSPCPDGAIALQRHRIHSTPGNGGEAGEAGHLHRGQALEPGSVADFAVSAPAPGPEGTVTLPRHRVRAPSGNGGHAGEAGHLHR